MLRKIRISIAAVVFVLITLLFLDFTGTIHAWFGWLAKIQFLPALFAINAGVIVMLIIITLIFGRIYCSVICPLGILQDLFAAAGRRFKKNRYYFSPSRDWLRYGFLFLFVVAMLAGFSYIVVLLAPYSSFGRIVQNLFAPLWQFANNFFARMAERTDSYAFYHVDVWIKSSLTFIVAAVTFVLLGVLAWRNGRTYCNTVCPVGTVLGFLSRFSLLRPVIDTSKCNKCGLCSRNCKSACIDFKNHSIDYSRCVACMDCIDKCSRGAIAYEPRIKTAADTKSGNVSADNHADKSASAENGMSRRKFLSLAAIFTASSVAGAQHKKVDGGLAVIADKQIPERETPIVPAGSGSLDNLHRHCTGCQLCVSVCPNQVLRPTENLSAFMQPQMSYERGYCRPECVECSKVCPTGAIRKVTAAEKSSIQIGRAVWIPKNCIPLTDGVPCGNCARHCPAGAIAMISSDPEDDAAVRIPAVNVEKCIGCGACENLCPARPFSAIYVEGYKHHRLI